MDLTHLRSSRRHFLAQQSLNIGAVALAWLLNRDQALAAPAKPALERPTFDLKPKTPPKPAQAKAMISLFMQGGPSHLDLFDPKPELTKRDGEKFTGDIKYDNAAEASAKLLGSAWKFATRGKCGMELSELLAGPGRSGRRHHARPLDAHGRQQPRPVDLRPQQRPPHPAGGRCSARGSRMPWGPRTRTCRRMSC